MSAYSGGGGVDRLPPAGSAPLGGRSREPARVGPPAQGAGREAWAAPRPRRCADRVWTLAYGGGSQVVMAISLTDAAASRVRTFLASRGSGLGLRLSVRRTGCSGFAYVVNYAEETRPDDVVFEDHGVKLFVDPESLALIDGTTVDFVKHGLNEAFRFHNPNVKGECGCGE